jgi:hypothetical protein
MAQLQNLLEWPQLYYLFKSNYKDEGYGTEFVIAFMEFWKSLPRENAKLTVSSNSLIHKHKHPSNEHQVLSEDKARERVQSIVRKNDTVGEDV